MTGLAARLTGLLMLILLAAAPLRADEPARIDPALSQVVMGPELGRIARWIGRDKPPTVDLHLAISRPVPYRAFFLDGPPRLVVDFEGLDFGDAAVSDLPGAAALPAMRWGRFRRGWGRLVMELPGTYRIAQASLSTAASPAILDIALEPVPADEFAPRPGADMALRALPEAAAMTARTPAEGVIGDGRVHVTLDPGHGGFDPGALSGQYTEAQIVLEIALQLAEALRDRGIDASLTREADRFVGLEQRMTVARAAGADLLISLHADALPQGEAAGATIYTWDPNANDRAARQLAMRHDPDDLLAGVDLEGADDTLAATLMAVARTDTQPRAVNFAKMLSSRLAMAGIEMHRRPVKGAGFSVLKSPDIPSVLFELGFLTDERDRTNLTDPVWRAIMVETVADAIAEWSVDDADRRALLRR